jgi:long-chain-fatty-acid---luciferin-component ligase
MHWEIDRLLDHPDPWHLPVEEAAQRRFVAVTEALAHHHQHSPTYRRFCEVRDFRPEQVRRREDLVRIPLLSTRAFKEKLSLLSVPAEQIVKTHHSSGTSGTRSLVPRDQVTLDRFIRSLERCILHLQGDSGYLAMLGPSPEELGSLSFANWSAVGCRLSAAHDFFLRNMKFDPAEVVAKANATTQRPVQIGGAPVLVVALARYILASGQRITTLTADSRITTGGGFKTHKGETIVREEYDQLVTSAFGVPRHNIRDIYAMSEINGFLGECSEGNMHVPPWMHFSVRNPQRLEEEVALGEEGLPAFLDASAHSYPGFVVADDIVRMVIGENDRCACGRIGPCIDRHVRRAEGAEWRGCGRQVDELRAAVQS